MRSGLLGQVPTTVVAPLLALAAACSDTPAAPISVGPLRDNSAASSTSPGPMLSGVSRPNVCADIKITASTAAAPEPGTPLQAWQCHGGVNQQFQLQTNGSITAYGGQLCLDVRSASPNDGERVAASRCLAGTTQKWTYTAAGQLQTATNGKCLDVSGARGENGTKLIVWHCHGGSNQKWTVRRAAASSVGVTPTTDVVVFPGQSIQAAVDANPPGTRLLLKAGTYVRQSVIPKSGDTFRGEGTATVLTGQDVTPFAFTYGGHTPYPTDVTITNLVVEHYAPPFQSGAIQVGLNEDGGGVRWTLDSLDVRYNGYLGVRVGNRLHLLRSRLYRNASMGYGGVGDSILIEGNEIAYNNPTASNMDFEGGGGKLVKTRWAVLRNNYSHHNGGVGLWTDIDNRDCLYEGNRVEYNVREGIAHETNGPGCVIRDNTLVGNGQQDARKDAWMWGAGIGIHASPNVEIYGNTLHDNAAGIALVQQARGAGAYGPYVVQNVYVHDNDIDVGTSWPSARSAGAVSDVDAAIFSRNNRFERNRYTLGQNLSPFAWAGAFRMWGMWRDYGGDVAGTAVVRSAAAP
ncbi:MAG TPA: ricin-type beta-trefoil lectin domain protein [Gemmatirosa sp.]